MYPSGARPSFHSRTADWPSSVSIYAYPGSKGLKFDLVYSEENRGHTVPSDTIMSVKLDSTFLEFVARASCTRDGPFSQRLTRPCCPILRAGLLVGYPHPPDASPQPQHTH